MTERIDFYVLNEQTDNGRWLLACRLTEKAYNLRHTVYVHTAHEMQAQQFDDLLWTFRQNSFVPHMLYATAEANNHADAEATPVLIGWQSEPARSADVLINLADDIPVFFEKFNRIVELVDQNATVLSQSRQRFRWYREQGYEPASHQL